MDEVAVDEELEISRALEESAMLHMETERQWNLPGHYRSQEGVMQRSLFNQFNRQFVVEVCRGLEAPTALCGFICMALGVGIADGTLSPDDCMEFSVVVPRVRGAVEWLDGARQRYMAESDGFVGASDAERLRYRRAWVANYEISDWLQHQRAEHVAFVRFNQWNDREVATHEEKARIEEEEGAFSPEEEVLVELFSGGRRLLGEEEGVRLASCSNVQCIIVDLRGHFVLAVRELQGQHLTILNTTSGNYLAGNPLCKTIQTAKRILL